MKTILIWIVIILGFTSIVNAKNGSWEDLQLEIYKDEKEIYPRSLSHYDLNAKKAIVSLLTKEKSLSFNCSKN